jgi:hypothetical protein
MHATDLTPELHVYLLRFVAAGQMALVPLNVVLPRLLKWKPDVDRMSLLVREVFQIHAVFITLTVGIWGVLTWQFAERWVVAPDELSSWLCFALALFWGLRCVMQWTHYSASHWRGQTGRTVIHWLLFVGYLFWTVMYAWTGGLLR